MSATLRMRPLVDVSDEEELGEGKLRETSMTENPTITTAMTGHEQECSKLRMISAPCSPTAIMDMWRACRQKLPISELSTSNSHS
jgi:hypothetical protein